MGRVSIILDTQYGSCGKGAVAQWLAAHEKPDLVIRTGGPNAGHSALLDPRTNRGIALRHIPTAAVSANATQQMALARAGLLNVQVLEEEIEKLRTAGYYQAKDGRDRYPRQTFTIDPLATVITHEHEEQEKAAGMRERIGSTREGVGAAQAAKIQRTAKTARDYSIHLGRLPGVKVAPVTPMAREVLSRGGEVHVEMTQGVGLGLHFGHYPFATSRDLTPGQALNDIGISPTMRGLKMRVIALARSYPIRVAGNSGPFGGRELTWEEMEERTGGLVKPERTTVTQLVRRIAEWDVQEVLDGCYEVSPTHGVLTFADYVFPEVAREVQRIMADEDRAGALWARVREYLTEETALRFARGDFDLYRAPFRTVGSDLAAVSWGFGLIVKTPAWDQCEALTDNYTRAVVWD